MPKAVFAGCARSCAPFLDGVLANVEAFGASYNSFELIVVENDSADDTRERLRDYAASRANVRVIEADGLDAEHPKRTDRIAAARNLYMDAVREPRYGDCDDLVILDFDDVNCAPIDRAAFEAARAWLWAENDRRAVFANSSFFYYDVWALRHPKWSPDDCWSKVRAVEPRIGINEAVRRNVAMREVHVSPASPPIPVESAFGGLGIYRREAALGGTYVGLADDGEEICEHVAFNAEVKGAGGVLAIYPPLQNRTPEEHILCVLGEQGTFVLEQDGKKCELIGPKEHPLQEFRAEHPLYDQRLPMLAKILSRHAPRATLVDVGANIGGTLALARLAGATMPAIAVEASLSYSKFLWVNMQRSQGLFGDTELVWGFAGASGNSGEVPVGPAKRRGAPSMERAPAVRLAALANGRELGLVKSDTDGFDHVIVEAELDFLRAKQPILWLAAHTLSAEAETKWVSLLSSMAEQWPKMILFDNFGFAIAAGETADCYREAVDLMAYGRRQRECEGYRPTLYYLDIALFPTRFDGVYRDFRQSIAELGA
jgi:hypothetical protein